MKNRWKTVTAWLLSIAGLSSCEAIEDIIGNNMCMYGTPYADYDVDIKITDEDGKPIPGIAAVEYLNEPAIAVSDKDGKMKFTNECTYNLCILRDVDGEANGGEFEDRAVTTDDVQTTQTKKGDKKNTWYNGRFDATGTIKMTRKKAAE